jgi:UDP-2,4-diacetamido-2,4,6-trideoxy-beta-L-altropyranose hydrolase
MSKNILFRADSSSTIGTGHIMRDLVLASKYKDANITFATQNFEGNINYKIIESNYKLEILNSNSIDELDSLIKKLDIDLLVIDHYDIDYTFEKELKIKNPKLKILSFDDTYEKHYCDILLNHNISANEDRYKDLVPDFCELRCGSDYTLLREEFIKEKTRKTIFLAMGGSDSTEVNLPILKILTNFKNIEVNLVTTTANSNISKIKQYSENKPWIKIHINSNKIAKLMKKSDLAIITPSVIANEIVYMELDFIAIKVADNQNDMYEYFKENNYSVLKNFNEEHLTKLLIEKGIK